MVKGLDLSTYFLYRNKHEVECKYRKYLMWILRADMKHIIKTYQSQCDAIMLFASDSVLEFYPKFGFKKVPEKRAIQIVHKSHKHYTVTKLNVENNQDKSIVDEKVQGSYKDVAFDILDNKNLLLFYWEICECIELYYRGSVEISNHVSYIEFQSAYVLSYRNDGEINTLPNS